ncbi:hypothetical protein C8D87_114153 [Lentzea atacamensis]|uniref:Uncharacterized protein n=2 Tax=Lentzea atacamensis TaxID=531938 RepID=A0ABX9DZK0_9PSEU|nr:hypothetical protein C8D87_114153 [Lentzea atacamensis]
MTALRAWPLQRDRMPVERGDLIAAAWYLGERNVSALAAAADVTRQTVYEDLRARDINPRQDRHGSAATPRYAPLTHGQLAGLAAHMSVVLAPAMLSATPEPLALAAWKAHQIITSIAHLLDPDLPGTNGRTSAEERAGWLDAIADYGADAGRAAHQQWADEASREDLAAFTNEALLVAYGADAIIGTATLNVGLPADGGPSIQVTLSTATDNNATTPEGWSTWSSNAPLPLAPVDGFRHLRIRFLLGQLAQLLTEALHPELLGLDEQ